MVRVKLREKENRAPGSASNAGGWEARGRVDMRGGLVGVWECGHINTGTRVVGGRGQRRGREHGRECGQVGRCGRVCARALVCGCVGVWACGRAGAWARERGGEGRRDSDDFETTTNY